MANIDFPSVAGQPSDGSYKFTDNQGQVWVWDGIVWSKEGAFGSNTSITGNAIKRIVNLRLSLSNNNPYPTTTVSSNQLFVHGYEGNEIALYDPSAGDWELVSFSGAPAISLAPCSTGGRVYDIYLYKTGSGLAGDFVRWSNNTSVPARGKQDGIIVKNGEPHKRFVGTLLTSTAGNCQNRMGKVIPQSKAHKYPRISLANYYNTFATKLHYFLGNGWTKQSSSWRTPPGWSNPKVNCEFVLARNTLCTAHCSLYYNKISTNAAIAFVAAGIDDDNTPHIEGTWPEVCLRGLSSPSCANIASDWAGNLGQGKHNIYYLYRQTNGSCCCNEHTAFGLIVTLSV